MLTQTLSQFLYCCKASEIYKYLSQRKRAPQAVVLAYHRVAPLDSYNSLMREMVVEPEQFELQLQYLAANCRVLSLDEFVRKFSEQKVPKDACVITFDDAYMDNYEFAYPLLKKYDMPATIYVPTSYIETKRRFYWDRTAALLINARVRSGRLSCDGRDFLWDLGSLRSKTRTFIRLLSILKEKDESGQDEIFVNIKDQFESHEREGVPEALSWDLMREMKKEKISFGAHTVSHRPSSRLDSNQLFVEMKNSKDMLDKHLSQKTNSFAYPYGGKEDISDGASFIAKACGFECASTLEQGLVTKYSDPYLLPRIGVGGNDNLAMFVLKLSGLISAVHSVKNPKK